MKKTYLKPEVLSMNIVIDNILDTSAPVDNENPSGKPLPGSSAAEQQGDWNNIWK